MKQVRLLEKTPKNALRVPFFQTIFPDACFIYLYRDPREEISSMMDAWRSGRFVTYPQLPGWAGLPWSLVLVPGWREMIGKPLAEIVARQWATTTQVLLDDLERLPPEQWCVTSYDRLVSDPQTEVERLCGFVNIAWDRHLTVPLPLARHALTPPDPEKWRQNEAALACVRWMARISCPGRACTLAELTPSGNQVTAGDGGGVFVYGAYSSIAVRHTTIAGNTATGTGGGMVVRNDVVTVEHTIVADNILTPASTPNDVGTPRTGSFAVSFSLIEAPGTADITDNGGNAPNVDPQLAKLANNGGPTLTHLPANGSPAVNTGNPSIVAPPSTGQRGLTRVCRSRDRYGGGRDGRGPGDVAGV